MPRPQDPAITEAVLDAAMALLVERGFAEMSMEAIAVRAGVGKPAIYRRFASKAEVVVAAIARALPELAPEPPPAGGGDLRGLLRALVEQLVPEDPQGYAAFLGGLMAERSRHPELIGVFRERVLLPRRAVVRAAVERAQRAGAVRADVDPEVAVDLLGGAFTARAFAGLPMDAAWRAAVADACWHALAAR